MTEEKTISPFYEIKLAIGEVSFLHNSVEELTWRLFVNLHPEDMRKYADRQIQRMQFARKCDALKLLVSEHSSADLGEKLRTEIDIWLGKLKSTAIRRNELVHSNLYVDVCESDDPDRQVIVKQRLENPKTKLEIKFGVDELEDMRRLYSNLYSEGISILQEISHSSR